MNNAYFVVRDESLHDMYGSPFVKWLEEKGYKKEENSNGWYDRCDWIWIDIEHGTYRPAMPGICFGMVAGNHVITIDEFKSIREIFFKYQGLRFMSFTLKEQLEVDAKKDQERIEWEKYWDSTSLESYKDDLKTYMFANEPGMGKAGVIEVLQRENRTVEAAYRDKKSVESLSYILRLIW